MSITLLVASHSTPGSSNIIVGNSKAFVFQSMKFTSHAVPPGMFTSVYSCGTTQVVMLHALGNGVVYGNIVASQMSGDQ